MSTSQQVRLLSAMSAVVLACVATAVAEDPVTLENTVPVVIKTVPVAGSDDVDPALGQIQVTFSKPMRDGAWSWVQMSKESFPELQGDPKYLKDGRTCVVDVKLKPNQTYAIWLNSSKFQNFKDPQDRPAVPYFLVFKTGPGK